MIRCRLCAMPDTRPDTEFVGGVCSACLSFEKRKTIDWAQREKDLLQILENLPRNGTGFDCIVPSSGGKDSTWQTLKMIELGVRPLVVTATTCHLTNIGKKNIENLARFATTIEVSPNKTVRAKLNRIGLTMVGDISWPEHVSIFTTPFKVACNLGIPLIWYGENPQEAYGGPIGSDEAREMTRRWVSEFGGFLGMRPRDMVGLDGITEKDMEDYLPPSDEKIKKVGVQARFLGQYYFWDSHRNTQVAKLNGMIAGSPCRSNWWEGENMDNAQTGLHDYFGFLKYGYGRGCAQISVDIRSGRINRNDALDWVSHNDGQFPEYYVATHYSEVLKRIGMDEREFRALCEKFRNPKAHQ